MHTYKNVPPDIPFTTPFTNSFISLNYIPIATAPAFKHEWNMANFTAYIFRIPDAKYEKPRVKAYAHLWKMIANANP